MYQQRLRNIVRESHFPVESYGPDHFVLTDEMVGELRTRSYFERWKIAIENGWYHLRLEDQSLFLFQEGNSASYSYLHCPLAIPSYRQFLEQLDLDFSQLNRRHYRSDYESVLDTASLRANVTPIRFDLDRTAYKAGVHPLGHLHVGLDNDVRLAVSRSVSAVSFVLFTMRQMYPKCWARLLERRTPGIAEKIRQAGDALPEEFWSEIDRIELYFH